MSLSKILVVFAITLGLSHPLTSEANAKCKKGWEKVSCEDVEGAARKFFCWNTKKGDLDEEMKGKKCAMAKKKKKIKKKMKSKKSEETTTEEN